MGLEVTEGNGWGATLWDGREGELRPKEGTRKGDKMKGKGRDMRGMLGALLLP
jgi:hypothetical protein